MANIFRFKQFSVDQTGCAMKINTDGVLLGALAESKDPHSILDIGTGTGVIALMLAQRYPDAVIDAVEIDPVAAETATKNFQASAFANRLTAYPLSFENFFEKYPDKKFDLIVSNPPFYINALESPSVEKTLAKHAVRDFFATLIENIASHLSKDGLCYLILPIETATHIKELSARSNLNAQKAIDIKSYPDSLPHREILILSFPKALELNEEFTIYEEPKKYSNQYEMALKDFFIIF
jgi:tRNA1Val (adenine37-N6)-methyltransferase